jgi:hypothetical protein
LLSFDFQAQSEIKVSNLKESKIPKSIKFAGKIKKAVTWEDENGKNIVITTETGEYQDSNSEMEDARAANLYAYHFIVTDKSSKLVWKLEDGIDNCPVDINENFIKNTLKVTDLDKDGESEIWIMYKTACRGDVSPCTMKIIMYEGSKKHALRGENKVKLSETETYGGQYNMDKVFKKSPNTFQDFAIKMWEKNILETW